jgi:hypothetical protein
MFEKDVEERLDALEKGLEDLSARVKANEKKQDEEVTLIPGVEYDFVPSYEPKAIGRYIIQIRRVVPESNLLGLTDEEWQQFATEDDA